MLRVIKLQKAAARIILDKTYRDRSEDMFKDLGWQKIENRIRDKRLVMVYNSLNGKTPSYITDMFTTLDKIHTHYLRSTIIRKDFHTLLPKNGTSSHVT